MRALQLLLVATLSIAVSICSAASWDGRKGDFTLTTWASAPGQTTFTVTCSNPTVAAIRFKITFASPSGDLRADVVRVVDLVDLRGRKSAAIGSVASFIIAIEQANIVGTPQITPLYEGAPVDF